MCARQKSIIKIQGQIGNLLFYSINGKDCVREISSPGKDKIKTSPAFKRNRENMMEFGDCSLAGKAFRLGLGEIIKDMGGQYISARLTALFKNVIIHGTGTRGQRSIAVLKNGHFIEGFDFNPVVAFGGVFNAPYTITANAGRNEVTIDIPVFKSYNYISVPKGVSHFRIINALAVLSDYNYNSAMKGYRPLNLEINSKKKIAYSAYSPLGGSTSGSISVVASIPGAPNIPISSGLISSIGIEFYQEINGEFYLLSAKNAMRLERVF
ncbi:MAG: hypothetical protein H0X62_13420 [Bacteroidetes bacterium]|nr:hypothetical protein [Bacteroidota bacterium]